MYEFGYTRLISLAGVAIETVGVVVILAGIAVAVAKYLRSRLAALEEDIYPRLRRDIGRTLMVGLEFLVAGDIVRTVIVSPTLTDVASLGLLVLVRTVLVFTIHLEVEGRWPWQPDSNA